MSTNASNMASAILAVFFLSVCLVIGIWDVYVTYISGAGETVSTVLGKWGGSFPILPLVIGLVLGHLFWPRVPVIDVPAPK